MAEYLFIDNIYGDDANDGKSPDKPKRHQPLRKSINATVYVASFPRGLTPRHAQIASCLLLGLENQEIAKELGISTRTVKACMAKMMRVLGAKNRVALAIALMRDPTWRELLEASETSKISC